MTKKTFFYSLLILLLIALNVYLFVTAPAPLSQDKALEKKTYSVEEAFELLAHLNDSYRTLYTKAIVGKGKENGLNFDEDWQNKKVEAGPLPALFLRGTSQEIEKRPIPLGLYLGSDFPIEKSNKFSGIQAEKFQEIRTDRKPRFFYDTGSERHIAMFPDIASAAACVSCHNEHPNTSKDDWKLGDIMGATTWSYPKDSLSTDEVIEWVQVYQTAALTTYAHYLSETQKFTQNEKPSIGENWPDKGYYLPSRERFADSVNQLTAAVIADYMIRLDEF